MVSDIANRLKAALRDVPDFPKPGIVFKDITPILGDAGLFRDAVDALAQAAVGANVDLIAGIEARGFLFGAALAMRMELGFIPIRKKGKLPYRTRSVAYALEYGTAEIEMHADALGARKRVLLVDDVLATGGTAAAAARLIEEGGGEVVLVEFLVELTFLDGRRALGGRPMTSVIKV